MSKAQPMMSGGNEVQPPKRAWTRKKNMEIAPIIGWYEDGYSSIITLTKGLAHIVHKGQALTVFTPAESFSEKPDTIAEKVERFLN